MLVGKAEMDDNNLWRPGASEKLGCRTRGRVNRYYILGGISEEDLPLAVVVLLYFLLASAHLSGHEFEAYSTEILALARRRLVIDRRDEESIELLVKSYKGILICHTVLLLSKQGTPLSQKNRLPVETEVGDFVGVVQCRGASRPRTRVLINVGSVAMMSSSGARGDPVAANSDGAFEHRHGLALDAQIDRGLCCSAALVSPRYCPRLPVRKKGMLAFVLAHPG
jgi:hypothetical protein